MSVVLVDLGDEWHDLTGGAGRGAGEGRRDIQGSWRQPQPRSLNVPVPRPRAPILTIQAAVKHLGECASTINIGSGVSRITPAFSTVYSGTKGALDAITGVLARELGPKKIRVNSINPGVVETEGAHTSGMLGSDFEKSLIAQAPLGRTGTVGDIAPIAVFLASDDSAWLTGELVLATGGIR